MLSIETTSSNQASRAEAGKTSTDQVLLELGLKIIRRPSGYVSVAKREAKSWERALFWPWLGVGAIGSGPRMMNWGDGDYKK